MKSLMAALLLLPILGLPSSSFAEVDSDSQKIAASWQFSPVLDDWSVEVIQESATGVEVEFHLNRLSAESRDGGIQLVAGDLDFFATPGVPTLPFWSGVYGLPARAGVSLEILQEEHQDIPLSGVRAARDWQSDRAGSPAPGRSENTDIFSADAFWPSSRAELGEPALWHGVRVAPLDLHPLRWNPQSEILRVSTRLVVRISFLGDDFRNSREIDRPVSAAGQSIVLGSIQNPQSQQIQADRLDPQDDVYLGRYLVILPESAVLMLDPWVQWKRQMGYRVHLLTREEIGTNPDFQTTKAMVELEYLSQGIDYLVLVGDMDYTQGLYYMPANLVQGGGYAESTWGGDIASDHEYSLLEGNDYFPDLLVGRLSVDAHQQLATLVTKLVDYEKTPPDAGANNWYNNAGMVYDIALAGSRRETMYAVADKLTDFGFDQFTFIENDIYSNPLSPAIVTSMVNAGASFVNYRGYGYRYQWAGPFFGVNQIMGDLTNFAAWPFVTSIVCGGGDFGSNQYDPCFGEAWLRAANGPNPKGAIGFIGPSEEDTHTKWNNAISTGIYQGLTEEGITQLGALMNRGKMELWTQFPNSRGEDWSQGGAGNNVPHYFHSYNLLGDPGLRARSRRPLELVVDVVTELAPGQRQLDLMIADGDGQPVSGADIYVYHAESQSGVLAQSGVDGRAILDLGELEAGELVLTVHGANLYPFQQQITVSNQSTAIAVQSWSIDDTAAGNSDGAANPGEAISLNLQLYEAGIDGYDGQRELRLESASNHVQLNSSIIALQSMDSGQTIDLDSQFSMTIAGTALHGSQCPLDLYLDDQWLVRIEFETAAPTFSIENTPTSLGSFEPGEMVEFSLDVLLNGAYDTPELQGQLLVDHSGAQVNVSQFTLPALNAGDAGQSTPLALQLDAAMLPGTQVSCWAQFSSGGQIIAESPFTLTIGTVAIGDPQGPDAEGYVIYHSLDTDYEEAPTHVWNDISSIGTALNVADVEDSWSNGGIDGVSTLIDLPFPFVYYGESHIFATVNTNGWLAMGEQLDYISARNTRIPGAQGPPGMIALMWADLYNAFDQLNRFGDIYTYYNESDHTFTIQWHNFRHAGYNNSQSFQIILRDPAHWPTENGNGEILFVYNDVNTSYGDNAATIGIENYQQSAGLQVTFNNEWCDACQSVVDGTTLLITNAPAFEETGVKEDAAAVVADFRLISVAPNPFNPGTRITMELGQPLTVSWALFDIRGRRVANANLGSMSAGVQQFNLDGTGLSSGLYLLQISRQDNGQSLAQRKVLLLK